MPSRSIQIPCALTLTLLLGACAHAVRLPAFNAVPPPSREDALKQVQAATPCCKSWDELPFDHALPARPVDYQFDRGSPVAELDGQHTHFLDFVLPPWHAPYRVLFKAEPSARQLQSSYLFAPTATLLDAQFKPLRSEDVKLCEYIGWRPSQSGAFGSIRVDDKRAKFLVITTSAAQLKATTYWEQSPAGFSSDVMSPASSGDFSIPHGPDGALSVGLLSREDEGTVSDAICGKPGKP